MRLRAAVAITALLVAGCKLNTDYFKDYRGVNLMSAYGFQATKPLPASGPQWDLEPYQAYVTAYGVGYNPTDYMTWQPASDLAGVFDSDAPPKDMSLGKDGTSPAYRLEIKNLFADGDFESQTAGTTAFGGGDAAWWTSLSGSATVQFDDTVGAFVSPNGTYNPISNMSLFFSGPTAPQLQVQLNTSSVSLWSRAAGYRFRFDFRYTGANAPFHVAGPADVPTVFSSENGGQWDMSSVAPRSSTLVPFSRFFTKNGSTTAANVVLGSNSNLDEAVIDNVRVVNNDINPYVTASFPSLTSGSLQLVPGSKAGDYVLSFWVHDDPTADQTGLSGIAHVANRLEPSGITVEVTAAVKSGAGTFVQFVPRPLGGWPVWTQLTFPMGFDFVDSDSLIPSGSAALKFQIAPTNTFDQSTNGRDAGSVLIAQPTFTFNP